MKIKVYDILSDRVDAGIAFGLNRAFKHTDHPTREQLADDLHLNIMVSIDEIFSFEDECDDV